MESEGEEQEKWLKTYERFIPAKTCSHMAECFIKIEFSSWMLVYFVFKLAVDDRFTESMKIKKKYHF